MGEFYGSVGFSLAVMGLIAVAVLAPARAQDAPALLERLQTPDALPGAAGWGEEARLVAERTARKYGAPDEATAEAMIWRSRDPFKRIVVRRDGATRHAPVVHTQYLEQTVSYRVPPEKFSALAEFDGGLLADRARGELTARSDREELNFLVLNLADEVARGKRTPASAKSEAVKVMAMTASGKSSAMTSGLLFPLTRANAGDPR